MNTSTRLLSTKLTIVTAITGGVDLPSDVNELKKIFPQISFVAFSDDLDSGLICCGWALRPVLSDNLPISNKFLQTRSNREIAKIPKICSFYYIKDSEYTLWIDANIILTADFVSAVLDLLSQSPCFATFLHPKRSNVFEELVYNLVFGKISLASFSRLAILYVTNLTFSSPLRMGGILLINNNIPHLKDQLRIWLDLVFDYCSRDQLLLPYVLNSSSIPCINFPRRLLYSIQFKKHISYSHNEAGLISRYIGVFSVFIYNLISLCRREFSKLL